MKLKVFLNVRAARTRAQVEFPMPGFWFEWSSLNLVQCACIHGFQGGLAGVAQS